MNFEGMEVRFQSPFGYDDLEGFVDYQMGDLITVTITTPGHHELKRCEIWVDDVLAYRDRV